MNNQKPKSRMQYGLKCTAATCCGNTLVPVLIALVISMAASVTFLQQGKVLNEKTLMLEAPDELIRLAQKLKKLRKTKTLVEIKTKDLGATYNVFENQLIYEAPKPPITSSSQGQIRYATNNSAQCQELAALLVKHPDVSHICCDCYKPGSSLTTITIYQY